MKVVTSEQMRRIDRRTIEQIGIPGIVLMENAGRAVADLVCEMKGSSDGSVFLFCGKGNNGGDGFVAARHLHQRGYDVQIYLLARREDLRGDARTNADIAFSIGLPIFEIPTRDRILSLDWRWERVSVIVDAILGTGAKGAPEEPAATCIELINSSGRPVVSVDIPSGLDPDTGRVEGSCIRAKATVTFAFPKIGLLLYPGAENVGDLRVADISIPEAAWRDMDDLKVELVEERMVGDLIPIRKPDMHKGEAGRVLVIAGSRGLTGAAAMCSLAAARSGAGLVTLLIPESLNPILEVKLTEPMTFPLPETDSGTLSLKGLDTILELCDGADVVAIGPGLSRNPETSELIRRVLRESGKPMVVDADGLNALEGDPSPIISREGPTVITPHPGEMGRICGIPTRDIQMDRIGVATGFASKWGVVIVLKGARTITADPSGRAFINPTGNPGMASGGMGDILTGLIAGLIGQGLKPLEAAVLGTYIHGFAGDMAAKEIGDRGILATDLLDRIPRSFQILLGRRWG